MPPSQRPGLRELLDPYTAWCFDETVLWFGTWVESELAKVEGRTPEETASRRSLVLRRILGGEPLFADPLAVKEPLRPEDLDA